MAGYHVIYADPPWQYNDRNKNGNRGAECKYPVLSRKQMQEMPVERLAANDALLFLWATMPTLPDAIDLVQAWGFKYTTVAFVWVKTYEKSGKHFVGLGHWTRANAELVLLGKRGKPKRAAKDVGQVIECPHPDGPHSSKPDIVRTEIVRLAGDVPRVEMFAREWTPGWDVWGNEVNCSPFAESVLGAPTARDTETT